MFRSIVWLPLAHFLSDAFYVDIRRSRRASPFPFSSALPFFPQPCKESDSSSPCAAILQRCLSSWSPLRALLFPYPKFPIYAQNSTPLVTPPTSGCSPFYLSCLNCLALRCISASHFDVSPLKFPVALIKLALDFEIFHLDLCSQFSPDFRGEPSSIQRAFSVPSSFFPSPLRTGLFPPSLALQRNFSDSSF